ncbi:conserved exported hypothetical protein [Vibrio jasicida]|uniref:Lipoprotein n=1 Tax=Vibrio jasicida TaxID=766224 RepID=A0AAU9QVX6_9VIBR|nr:conserved exported hypothetical protein [Vibrio jasicida]CAH1601675.1 conserved exported hypothetical protein [Vibrio jasicida]
MNLKLSHSAALIAAALFTGTMVGCASTEEPSKQVEVTPEEQNIINKTKITQALLNITPEWYLAPPQSTRGDIYAVATAVNSDIQFATNRAVLLGEQQVVKKMATEVSSLETNDITNSGGSNNVVSTEYIEARINQAGLFGHNVVKREYFPDPETGEFRVFVMIHLDAKAKADILTAAAESDETLRENEQLQKTIEDLKQKAEAEEQAKKNA